MAPAGAKQARQRKGRAVKGTPGRVNVELCASSTQPASEEAAAMVSSRRKKPREGAAATSAAATGPGKNTKHAQEKRGLARVASSSKDGRQQPTTAMVAVPRGRAAKTQHIPSSTQAMRTRRVSAASQSERLASKASAKGGGAKEAEALERVTKQAQKRRRSSRRASATETSQAAAATSVQPGKTTPTKESDDAAKAMQEGGRAAHSSRVGDAEEPSHTAAAEELGRRKRGRPSKAQKGAEDAAAEQLQAARRGVQQLPAGQPAAEPSGAEMCAVMESDPPSKRRRTGPCWAQIGQTAATAEGSQESAGQKTAKEPLSQQRRTPATAAPELALDEAAQARTRGAATPDKSRTMDRRGGENAEPGLDSPRKSPLLSKRGARIPLSPTQQALPLGASGLPQPPCPADAAEAEAATASQFEAASASQLAADGGSKAEGPFTALQTEPDGPPTPQDSAWFDPTDTSKVHAVETALHVSQALPGSLPLCRDAQAHELMRLLQLHISSCQGGSVYVSGLPGTGKSLTVHEVARQCWAAAATTCQGPASPTFVSINCMSLQQPSAVFRRALEAFQQGHATARDPIIYSGGVGSASGHENALAALKDFVQQPLQSTPVKKSRQHTQGMLVLILDEMDQLMFQSRSVLYELFALPQLPRSRLILLGISNSIDMAERTLPLLRDLGSHPHAVPFPSYSAQQMGDIIRQRLSSLPGPVFQEHAVTFCARKMAAHSGDMRRALEACASALKILVADAATPATPEDSSQGAEGTEGPAARVTAPKRRLVGLGDMAEAVSSLQGGAGEASAAVQAMRSLPQQQQLVLCVAAKLLGQPDQTEAAPPGGRAPGTPTAKSKAQRQRSGVLLSPSACRTPSGKGRQPGTPAKAPGPSVSRSALLGASQECSLGLLHESYMQLCKQVAMKPLSSIEFTAACSTLADMGIMAVGKAREERQRKVSLRTHKDDVALALKDARLLRNFLSL